MASFPQAVEAMLYSFGTYCMNFIFVCGTGVTVYAKRIKLYLVSVNV